MSIIEDFAEAVGDATVEMTLVEYAHILAKRTEIGVEQERDRIIKLLEEIITERKKVDQTNWVQNEISNLHYLIELIEDNK